MMEHLSTLLYRLFMLSSICILEEFNFFLFIYFIVNSCLCICAFLETFSVFIEAVLHVVVIDI